MIDLVREEFTKHPILERMKNYHFRFSSYLSSRFFSSFFKESHHVAYLHLKFPTLGA